MKIFLRFVGQLCCAALAGSASDVDGVCSHHAPSSTIGAAPRPRRTPVAVSHVAPPSRTPDLSPCSPHGRRFGSLRRPIHRRREPGRRVFDVGSLIDVVASPWTRVSFTLPSQFLRVPQIWDSCAGFVSGRRSSRKRARNCGAPLCLKARRHGEELALRHCEGRGGAREGAVDFKAR